MCRFLVGGIVIGCIFHCLGAAMLEVLSLGVYFIVQVLLWLWRAEGEAASCSLLRHDFLVMSFCFFLLTVCILVTEAELDLT